MKNRQCRADAPCAQHRMEPFRHLLSEGLFTPIFTEEKQRLKESKCLDHSCHE